MPVSSRSAHINIYWIVGSVGALLLGALTRLLLSHPGPNPVLDMGQVNAVSRLGHYLFHPLTYAIVVIVFAFRVIQLRGVGFWSILFSFVVGGISTTLILMVR